jgi:hypothetical protein
MSTACSPFSSRFITSNLSWIPIVYRRFFTWIAPGDADLRFSLTWVRKASAVEEETRWAAWLYHIHVTDGVTVTSLYASLQHKTRSTMDRVCHIALKRKLSGKFEKLRKCSSRVRAKSCKKERPACTVEQFTQTVLLTLRLLTGYKMYPCLVFSFNSSRWYIATILQVFLFVLWSPCDIRWSSRSDYIVFRILYVFFESDWNTFYPHYF